MKSANKFATLIVPIALAVGISASLPTRAQDRPADEHSQSTGQAGSDTWITTKVKTELATTKGISSTDISVETVNGVVTLTGVLPTDIQVKKAVAAAKSIKGVKSVDASGLKSK